MEKVFCVYILTNKRNGTLYTGISSDLKKRVVQHRLKMFKGFSSRYGLNRLVYYEAFGESLVAIAREKEIKGWLRIKKVRLIEEKNPLWRDLFDEL